MSRVDAGVLRGGRSKSHGSDVEAGDGSPKRPTRTFASLVASVAAGAYLVGAAALAGVVGPTLAHDAYPFLPLAALVVVGLPVGLYLRDARRGPLALLAAVLAFWHVYVPLFESTTVETPTFVLALYFAPVYLGAYLLANAIEGGMRKRRRASGQGT